MNPLLTAGQMQLKGVEPVMRRLRNLSPELRKKGLVAAVRKGANVVKRAAVNNAKRIDDPDTAERIWKNIVVQAATRYNRRGVGIMMRVGVRGGARKYGDTTENRRKQRVGKKYKTLGSKSNPGGDTWYWRFVEFGVPNHGIAARAFMLPALRQNAGRAADAITSELSAQLDKLAKKGSR